MFRWLMALVVVLAVNSLAVAQSSDRSRYKLLWKISGKGLKKPSYLFGTMHVRDREAFDFSDSVLLKLEACEAFAMEVHPDSATRYYFGRMMDGVQQEDQLRKQLSPEAYKRLDSLLIARDSVSLTNFKTSSEVSSYLSEKYQKKDKPTFLDAWLYNIAQSQNKKILGLEDFREQVKLLADGKGTELNELKRYLEKDPEASRRFYQLFLNLYASGDIDSIRTYSKNETDLNYDELVTKRNLVMATSIIEAIHQQPTFIAVGAAHLPGEEGIIYLLRKKGYSVTLVKPVFTGLASKYTFTKTEQQWVEFSSTAGGYAVDMPKKPISYEPGKSPITFHAHIDIGSMAMYMVSHVEIPQTTQTNSAMLEAVANNMAMKNVLLSEKKVKVSGYDGLEVEFDKNGQYLRVLVVLRGPVMYMLMAGSTKEKVHSEDANRFFKSLRTFALPVIAKESLVHAAGAFAIDMPGKVSTQQTTPKDEELGRSYKIHLFFTNNTGTKEGFIFRYNDFIPGYVALNDTLYMNSAIRDVVARMKGNNIQTELITHEGFPCTKFAFSNLSGTGKGSGFVIMRGSRFYLGLVTRSAPGPIEGADAFLKSLRFLPYQKTTTKTITVPDGITLQVPEKFELDSSYVDKKKEHIRYSFVDVNSGVMTTLQIEELSPYDESTDAETYFKTLGENLPDEGDTIVAETSFSGTVPGYEYVMLSDRVETIKRVKFFVADKRLISLWSFLPPDHVLTNLPDEMFNSFSVKSTGTWNLFQDKTDVLLRDLTSTDTLIQEEASLAIRDHEFEKADLSGIYKALQHQYQDDSKSYGTKGMLLGVLVAVHDETTSPFIQKIYTTLTDTTHIRNRALKVLASLQTEEDTKTILRLMQADARTEFDAYDILESYSDSLQLLNSILPELIAMEPRFSYGYYLFETARNAFSENALQKDVKENVIRQALLLGNKLVALPIPEQDSEDNWNLSSRKEHLAEFLTEIPFTPEVKALLLRIHEHKSPAVRLVTSIHLLKHNVAIPSTDLDAIARDREYRFEFYDSLIAIGKEKLMNKRYRTPVMLAESDFYEYLMYDEEEPDSLVMVSEIKVKYEGKSQTVFLFKYTNEYSEGWVTGMAGPYDLKRKGGLQRGDLTTAFYEDFVTTAKLKEYALQYIKEQEEETDEEE